VGLVGAETADAEVTGLMPEGGVPPFRLPSGALDFLDGKQYIHNMTIHSYIAGVTINSGEPQANLWARGMQRMLPADGGFLEISNPLKPEIVHKGVFKGGLPGVAYNIRLKKWLLMPAAAQPLTGATPRYPLGQYEAALRMERIAYKGLRGIRVYDVTNPEKPDLLQEFSRQVQSPDEVIQSIIENGAERCSPKCTIADGPKPLITVVTNSYCVISPTKSSMVRPEARTSGRCAESAQLV
jgi:hypothetical protein